MAALPFIDAFVEEYPADGGDQGVHSTVNNKEHTRLYINNIQVTNGNMMYCT